ncbi:type VII secretion-associated serine protease mycosin [Actinomadura chokoriensis]
MDGLTPRAWGRRICAGAVAIALTWTAATPAASAAPVPRSDEWWFHAWSVETKVWPLSKGTGVTVAVIDDGVNARLPELSGAVLPGLDTAGGHTRGQVDFDEQGHGTSIAALIAGRGGGRTAYVGLAPEAKIIPVRLPHGSATEDNITEIAQGIRFAVDHGAKVVNMSIGGTSVRCEDDLQSAIAYAIGHDVVLVAAAGNDGDGTNAAEQPARCPGVLAVGAVTKATKPWHRTQRQNYVTISAPGAQMGLVGKDGTYYPDSAGTSGAAALTSAAVALIRSRNPGMSGRTVVQRILATAMPIGGEEWDPRTGYGVLLVRNAMDPAEYPVPSGAPNPVYEAFDRWKASTDRAPSRQPVAAAKPEGGSGGLPVGTIAAGAAGASLVVAGLAAAVLIVSRRRKVGRRA